MCIFLVLLGILCYVDFLSGSTNMAISLFGMIGSLKMSLKMLAPILYTISNIHCRLYGIAQTTSPGPNTQRQWTKRDESRTIAITQYNSQLPWTVLWVTYNVALMLFYYYRYKRYCLPRDSAISEQTSCEGSYCTGNR